MLRKRVADIYIVPMQAGRALKPSWIARAPKAILPTCIQPDQPSTILKMNLWFRLAMLLSLERMCYLIYLDSSLTLGFWDTCSIEFVAWQIHWSHRVAFCDCMLYYPPDTPQLRTLFRQTQSGLCLAIANTSFTDLPRIKICKAEMDFLFQCQIGLVSLKGRYSGGLDNLRIESNWPLKPWDTKNGVKCVIYREVSKSRWPFKFSEQNALTKDPKNLFLFKLQISHLERRLLLSTPNGAGARKGNWTGAAGNSITKSPEFLPTNWIQHLIFSKLQNDQFMTMLRNIQLSACRLRTNFPRLLYIFEACKDVLHIELYQNSRSIWPEIVCNDCCQ